jgi:hypothetical protein
MKEGVRPRAGPLCAFNPWCALPVTFQILPARDLALITYTGVAGYDETMEAAAVYAAHPDFRPDQKFLFDLTAVTGHEQDFMKYFQMQGQMVELYAQTGHDQLIAFVAPSDAARDMAMLAQRSWEPIKHMVMLIHQEEAEVLRFLGQPERSIAALVEAAAATE